MKGKVRAFIMCTALVAALFTAGTAFARGGETRLSGEEPAQRSSPVKRTEPDGYILKEHNDRIGVFSPEGELLWETDIRVGALRGIDRQKLREGIYAAGREEAMKLLEDFGL